MLLGITYKEAAALFQWPRAEGRYCPSELYLILERRGWQWKHTSARERQQLQSPIPGALNLALVKVFENSSLYHAVVVLGDGTVLDPAFADPRRISDYFHIGGMSAALQPVTSVL